MQKGAVYNEEFAKRLGREFVLSLVFILFFLTLMVAFPLLACRFLNDSNFGWISATLSIVMVLLSWGIIYASTAHLAPSLARKKFLKRLESSKGSFYRGKILSCDKKRTPVRFISSYLITMKTLEGQKSFYFDEVFGEPPFKQGELVNVVVKMNFLCEIKEDDHE